MPGKDKKQEDIDSVLELERPRSRWIWRLLILILLLAAGGGGWWWYQRQPERAEATVSFQTQEVARGGLEVLVSATGTLEPVVQVDVGTEVSGTIRDVEVDFNDQVTSGQILARLDTTKLQAQLDQARAALAVAKAELVNAQAGAAESKITLERLKKAFQASGGRLPSRQDVDAAQASHDKALAQVAMSKAAVTKAEASLKGYQTDLDKTVIKAPITGLVLDRQVEPGQTVAASLSAPVLFTLAENLTSMSLSVSVDEADVGKVKEGQRATFVVDAYPDKKFPAAITQVRFAPKDDDGVVTYECILNVDNSDLLLRPGMTATADIVTLEVKDALLVPNSALRFKPTQAQPPASGETGQKKSFISKIMPGPPRRGRRQNNNKNGNNKAAQGESTVWVLVEGRPEPRPVKPGASDGLKTQIVSGALEAGDKVIVGQQAAAK